MRVRPSRRFVSLLVTMAITVATLGACGDEGPAESPGPPTQWDPRGGTRLQARYLVAEDGSRARVFEGWYDTLRQEPCRVARGEDGRYRCYPFTNRAVYRDARCREPMGEHLACPFRYTGVARGDARCDNETLAIYDEGAPVTPANQYVWTSETCQGPVSGANAAVVQVGARVPDSAFVSGAVTAGRNDLRLGPRLVRFEDGATASVDMLDARFGGRRCVRYATAEGARCLPENAVFIGTSGPYHGDNACTMPVAHANAPACLRPSVAIQGEMVGGCFQIKAAFAVGDRLDPREVYTGPDCQRFMVLPGHFYTLGAPIPLDQFPAIVEHERGNGRIRVRTYAAGDGDAIVHLGERLHDTSLGVDCRVATATDGVLRCLPLSGPQRGNDAAIDAFADSACRQPLARYDARAACGARGSFMAARVSQRRCAPGAPDATSAPDAHEPGRWEIFRLGPKHVGPIYVPGEGGCAAAQPATGDEFYTLAEVVEPRTFVAFRRE